MAVRLKSVFQKRRLPSSVYRGLSGAGRGLVFAGLLTLVRWWGPNPAAIAIFLAGNFLLYVHPLLNNLSFLASFLILLILSVVSAAALTAPWWAVAGVIGAATLLFFGILGLKNMQIADRTYWHYLIHNALLYWSLGVAFIVAGHWLWLAAVTAAVAVFFLVREWINLGAGDDIVSPGLTAAVAALAVGELIWAIYWLPLNAVSAAGILTALLYFFEQAFLRRRQQAAGYWLRRALAAAAILAILIVTA